MSRPTLSTPRVTSAVRCALLAGSAAVLLSACAVQNGTTGGAHPRKTGTAAGRACSGSDVHVRLNLGAAGVAAGTWYVPLDFTNTSGTACGLAGFPQVAFATGAAGRQIGAAASADRTSQSGAVVLAAGATAHVWLHFASVANFPVSACQPVSAPGFRVTLPGTGATVFIRHAITTCAKRVSGSDMFVVEPFQKGSALKGKAQ